MPRLAEVVLPAVNDCSELYHSSITSAAVAAETGRPTTLLAFSIIGAEDSVRVVEAGKVVKRSPRFREGGRRDYNPESDDQIR
jgi:hypothetical protein